ncbi:major capsid protein [Streptococcus parauberis]|uniref:major capsid protein n=1 Tax=Streptococcus parauberis TaxID=1348 RepID=UPI000E308BBB|nr:major capsid protein [Streptococcus parauberis]RFE01078.1 Phage major capsid protein E [Streptococcus parauberis]
MVFLHERLTSANIAGFYIEANSGVEATLGQKLFPLSKQIGATLDMVKGGYGRPVILRASAFDAKSTLRDRPEVEITTAKMPFFKETLPVKEEDIIQINNLSGNQKLQESVLQRAFKDDVELINAAKVRLEAMAMEVLATGKIGVKSNGVARDFDYGVDDDQKSNVAVAWTDPTANPLADLEKAIEAATERGYTPEVIYLNNTTFNALKNNPNTIAVYDGANKKQMSAGKFKEWLAEEQGLLEVVVINNTYIDETGVSRKYFPDNQVTLAPNVILGEMVLAMTPEESDLMAGNAANVTVVEQGIAVTTTKQTDPVNVLTKVSMVALPSFSNLNAVYMLTTTPVV